MTFLKAHWVLLAIGAVCLASLAGAGFAYMGGADIEKRMKDVSTLVGNVRRLQSGVANKAMIDAKKKEKEELKSEFERSMAAALARQKQSAFHEQRDAQGNVQPVERQLLIAEALPDPRPAVAFQFKTAYATAFQELPKRLRGRAKPAEEEIQQQQTLLDNLRVRQEAVSQGPWQPSRLETDAARDGVPPEKGLAELLRESASARAADVVAHSIYTYVDDGAFGVHNLVGAATTPTAVDIWQAQLSLWIQQDLAAALARCNEERAQQLRQQGVAEPYWVGQMPIKHLLRLSIADALGKGGGSNSNVKFAESSFTAVQNSDKMFVVPIQLDLVVQEAAIMKILNELSQVGFYTVIQVHYADVRPDPILLHLYIYGEQPVLHVVIDLEGYFFREVFEPWIPKELKGVLTTPGAQEDVQTQRG